MNLLTFGILVLAALIASVALAFFVHRAYLRAKDRILQAARTRQPVESVADSEGKAPVGAELAVAPWPELERLSLEANDAVKDLPNPHSTESLKPFKEKLEFFATHFLAMANLSPLPSPEVKAKLSDISFRLLVRANICRFPNQELSSLRYPAEGFYAVPAFLGRALANAQGGVKPLAKPPEENMVSLFASLREAIALAPSKRPNSLGEWRHAFDVLLRDVANLALQGSVSAIGGMQSPYEQAWAELKRDRDNSTPLDDEHKGDISQANAWLMATDIILATYGNNNNHD